MKIESWFRIGMKRNLPTPIDADESLPQYDLGCGRFPVQGAIALDYPDWEAPSPIPAADGSVGTIWANHFMEHLSGADAITMLREIQRCLVVGGIANIVTPYYTSQMQAHDLDHQSVYCEATWNNLFANQYYDKMGRGWALRVHTCFIIGIVERNLALFTQLIKDPK